MNANSLKNLKPFNQMTKENARKIQSIGGKAQMVRRMRNAKNRKLIDLLLQCSASELNEILKRCNFSDSEKQFYNKLKKII